MGQPGTLECDRSTLPWWFQNFDQCLEFDSFCRLWFDFLYILHGTFGFFLVLVDKQEEHKL